jgi:predicted kinase
MLIIISGPALSGKSTFLEALSKELNTLVIVSTDDIRMELYQSYEYKPECEKEVWSLAYTRLDEHLYNGQLVALDATLRTIESRAIIINRFQNFPIVYFAFEKPNLTLLLERNHQREWKQFPEEAIKKMHEDHQFPTQVEKAYYSKVFDVTRMDFSPTIKTSSEWIKNYYK